MQSNGGEEGIKKGPRQLPTPSYPRRESFAQKEERERETRVQIYCTGPEGTKPAPRDEDEGLQTAFNALLARVDPSAAAGSYGMN